MGEKRRCAHEIAPLNFPLPRWREFCYTSFAVKRNIKRFPEEFMFAVSGEEMCELVTNCDRFKNMKHSSVPMRAFTEHGIIMLASVLKSNVATVVSVRITRTFVAMRRTLATLAPDSTGRAFDCDGSCARDVAERADGLS